MRLVCFSDWRVQEFSPLIDFIGRLSPKPDLILYAGDDIERFAEWKHPIIKELFLKGFSREIKGDEITNINFESIVNYLKKQRNEQITYRNRKIIDFLNYFENEGKSIYDFDDDTLLLEEFLEDFIDITYQKTSNNNFHVHFQLYKMNYPFFSTNNYFEQLAKLTKSGVFAVIGNDCPKRNKIFISNKKWRKVHDLAEQRKIVKKFAFLGLEGIESIASTLKERLIYENDDSRRILSDIGYTISTEEEFSKKLRVFSHNRYNNKFKIILSHAPPYRCLDLAQRFGMCHIGSKALRKAILNDDNIKIVVCGHVHLYGGNTEKLNNATIINCASHDGEGSIGNVATVDLDNNTGDIINITWNRLGGKLEEIWYVGPKRASILRNAGYRTLSDLIKEDASVIHKKLNNKLKVSTIQKIQARCKALIENKIVVLQCSHTEIPKIDDWALIDIETSPDQSEVWCIGVLFQDKYYPFFVENTKDGTQVKRLFTDYLELLNKFQKENGLKNICCYSKTKFDFRIIDKKIEEHVLLQEQYQSLKKFDMYNLMTKYVVFPLSSFGLKSIANFFKYPRKLDKNYDGLRASFDYYNTFGQPTENETRKKMKRKLLLYNEEDTRMMLYIWEKVISCLNI